jgi:hypothetical protein
VLVSVTSHWIIRGRVTLVLEVWLQGNLSRNQILELGVCVSVTLVLDMLERLRGRPLRFLQNRFVITQKGIHFNIKKGYAARFGGVPDVLFHRSSIVEESGVHAARLKSWLSIEESKRKVSVRAWCLYVGGLR